MATTSPSSKRTRVTAEKPATTEAGSFAPLLVDTGRMQVLWATPVAAERGEGYQVFYELGEEKSSVYELVVKPAKRRSEALARSTSPSIKYPKSRVEAARELVRQKALRTVIQKTLASFEEVQGRHVETLSEDDLLREVGETLADKAATVTVSPEEGWQALVERGLRSKTALLKSSEFKSTTQASELVGIGEPAIRRRIREHKLFALKAPGDGEHRIPAWALDPGVAGANTTALHEASAAMDEWEFYHFMTSPNGGLNGLRPFECLLSSTALSAVQRSARLELTEELGLRPGALLLEAVREELSGELETGRA